MARRREPAWLRGRSSHRDTASAKAEAQSKLPPQITKFHDGQWQILFSTIAQSAAANSVQFRMPFLDLRIARVLGALPGRFHFRDGFDKWLLRQAMNGSLPEEIRQRRGGGILDDLVHEGLVRRERELVESLIENSRAADLGIVDATKIRWEFSRYWQDYKFVPWDLIGWINIEIWLRDWVP
jgi:asparagine synthase (glutamine-hydrolysing)